MSHIKVYSGKTISDKCGSQIHPEDEVIRANELINTFKKDNKELVLYSNHPDFVSAMKYIGLKHEIEVEFFLDGVSHGNDIEPTFGSFNKSLDLINTLGKTE